MNLTRRRATRPMCIARRGAVALKTRAAPRQNELRSVKGRFRRRATPQGYLRSECCQVTDTERQMVEACSAGMPMVEFAFQVRS
jgi:hypothetical protein